MDLNLTARKATTRRSETRFPDVEGELSPLVLVQMVLMEDNGDKPTLILDRDPEGLGEIVESSNILEAPHVREVSDAYENESKV